MRTILRSLYEYTFWADAQIFDCIEKLTDAHIKQPHAYSIGSVWTHITHLVGVEYWWLYFIWYDEMPKNDSQNELLADVRQQWQQHSESILEYIDSATDEELNRMVKPPHWDEDDAPVAVWQAMIQVANHSTDHRSQMLRLIHDLGGETFEQDYLNYLDTL